MDAPEDMLAALTSTEASAAELEVLPLGVTMLGSAKAAAMVARVALVVLREVGREVVAVCILLGAEGDVIG